MKGLKAPKINRMEIITMSNKFQLLTLAKEMINQTGGYGSITISNREEIKKHIGQHGSEIDDLINQFYSINCKVDNGGAPILKQIVNRLDYFYEIKLARPNACLMLQKADELIDCAFINKIAFETMTTSELLEEVKALASKNNITYYAINLN